MIRKTNLFLLAGLLITFHLTAQSPAGRPRKLLRLPGATLLMGDPPRSLYLLTGDKVVTLLDDRGASNWVAPSISADGSVIAAGRPLDSGERSPRGTLWTYSVKEKKWTDHHTFIHGRAVISPDGSQLTFLAEKLTENQPVWANFLDANGTPWTNYWPASIGLLAINTGKVTVLNVPRRLSGSWSPDGLRLAIDGTFEPTADEKTFRSVKPSIYTVDIQTRSATKIAEGITPAWSPSGEWIAYFVEVDSSRIIWRAPRYRLRMVRPDGTGARDLLDFGSWVLPNLPPVWSPDSKSLLLNVSNNADEDTWDIYQVDVETRKSTRRVKGARDVVFGWVKAN